MSSVVEHTDASSAVQSIVEAINKAADSGRFLIAVWAVEDGKVRLVQRTTHNFPSGDFIIAQRLLDVDLDAELRRCNAVPPPDLSPLPEASL